MSNAISFDGDCSHVDVSELDHVDSIELDQAQETSDRTCIENLLLLFFGGFLRFFPRQ